MQDIGWLDDTERAKRYKGLPVIFGRKSSAGFQPA